MNSNNITIAIDGFSSCGKSTLAKALAEKIGYIFIDTGAMYRSVTLFALRNQLISSTHFDVTALITALPTINLTFKQLPSASKPAIHLNGENVAEAIRSIEVNAYVSKVAAIKEVRQKLVMEQQKMGVNGGIVMDGRDIGSVVFPNAELKLFITASPEIRAQRRYLELKGTKNEATIEAIQQNLIERDYIDSTREESPLIQTEDAILIDNSNLTPDEQLNKVYELYLKIIK